MNNTAYYTDENFESFMSRSERNLKNHFYVSLIASVICQSGLWYVLLSGMRWCVSFYILVAISMVALFCLIGLGYCYYCAHRSRLEFEKMRREQREEMNALIDELEATRKILA